MRQIAFALQFKGIVGPGADGKLQAKTSASSQAIKTVLGASGIEASIESVAGDNATFESVAEISSDGCFVESGAITYGKAGKVTFKTLGRGMGASPIDGVNRGAVVWEVTGGDGKLAGASGLISSTFTVDGSGQITDNHFAVLFLP
ncbi:MAG: hypothetical protein ACREQB_10025 [Candidatus Binataceae bacterium]